MREGRKGFRGVGLYVRSICTLPSKKGDENPGHKATSCVALRLRLRSKDGQVGTVAPKPTNSR